MKKDSMRPCIELLEDRMLPAATLVGGLLAITGTNQADRISIATVGAQTQLTDNGRVSLFSGVTRLAVDARGGNDTVVNGTTIPAVISAGNGDDTVFAGNGGDTVDLGRGDDLFYGITGQAQNLVFARGEGRDRVYTQPASFVFAGAEDRTAVFFAPGRTPGAGSVTLEDGVLYVTPGNLGSRLTLSQRGGVFTLTGNLGDGNGNTARTFRGVRTVAYFGGSGDDVFVNSTSADQVSYGGVGGNDVLVGGTGRNLLKGGSGNDVLVGLGARNTLVGDGGADTLLGRFGTNFLDDDPLDLVLVF